LNDEARAPAVQLGWWQMTETQSGAFAIDNVLIGSSASIAKATYNETYVCSHLNYIFLCIIRS